GATFGALLDPLPASRAGVQPCRFRVLLHGNPDFPEADMGALLARRSRAYVGTGNAYEIVCYTRTRLLDRSRDGAVYECSGTVERGVHGTGMPDRCKDAVVGHLPGEHFVKLDRRVLKFPFEDRLVGTDFWLKFASYNAVADEDSMRELVDVEP